MDWLNASLLALLIVGHTGILIDVTNRIHACRLKCRSLRALRILHDVWLPAFPAVLIWTVGLHGPALLHGGSWGELSPLWAGYLGLSAVGLVGLSASAVRWNLRRLPALQLSNHSEIVDVEDRLGVAPLGSGPLRLLTHLPGNEMFRVKVSDKVYRLPRLPREWDGLSILHLTDFHLTGTVDRPFFEQIVELGARLEPDLIVFTGDLLDDQRLVEWLPETLGRLRAPLGCYFILGNHDWYLDPEPSRRSLVDLGWHDVAGRTVTLDASPPGGENRPPLVIGGTERPWMGTHPDYATAPEGAFRLLLSHTPDNLPWARGRDVDLMLSGHTHGGQVVLPVVGPLYCPSRFGVRYAAGPYWKDPTLLYVSRGLSAKHPVRWRCPPELTQLVLKAGCPAEPGPESPANGRIDWPRTLPHEDRLPQTGSGRPA